MICCLFFNCCKDLWHSTLNWHELLLANTEMFHFKTYNYWIWTILPPHASRPHPPHTKLGNVFGMTWGLYLFVQKDARRGIVLGIAGILCLRSRNPQTWGACRIQPPWVPCTSRGWFLTAMQRNAKQSMLSNSLQSKAIHPMQCNDCLQIALDPL